MLEQLVLRLDAVAAGRSFDDLAPHDLLVRAELATREVDVGAVRQTVPPVVVDLLAVDDDLAAQQDAAEEVVHHKHGGDALPACWVVCGPLRSVLGSAGVGAPGATERTGEVVKGYGRLGHVHASTLVTGADTRLRRRATIVRAGDLGERMSDFTYPEVGATAGDLPAGYHHVRQSRAVGNDREAFEAAATALLTWRMHEGAGVRKLAGPDFATAGSDVSFRWLVLRFECRVVSVLDEPDRRGFTYGTLAKHPECGEERFVVEIDPRTQVVTATITAFSKPSGWLVRAGGPVPRRVQAFMTRRYLDALASLADRPVPHA